MGQDWRPTDPRKTEGSSKSEPGKKESRWKHFGHFCARHRNIATFTAGAVITLAAVLVYSASRPPPQHLTQRDIDAAVQRSLATATPEPSYQSQVYQTIEPSVVRVEATLADNATSGTENVGIGAGVVVDDSGTILTALHVVANAISIHVTFADGTESAASITASQPENDLVVLRPSLVPDDVVPATLANSASLNVGDEVVAVGNPFGITDSLSSGVVSGLGRTFKSQKTGQTLTGVIQFDAAVNPGNSGGPLVNRDGEVVGIVTALLNPTDQDVFIGIGFAVPIETGASLAGAPPV